MIWDCQGMWTNVGFMWRRRGALKILVHFTLINRLAAVKVISMLASACPSNGWYIRAGTPYQLNWAEKIDTGKFHLFVTWPLRKTTIIPPDLVYSKQSVSVSRNDFRCHITPSIELHTSSFMHSGLSFNSFRTKRTLITGLYKMWNEDMSAYNSPQYDCLVPINRLNYVCHANSQEVHLSKLHSSIRKSDCCSIYVCLCAIICFGVRSMCLPLFGF